MRIIDGLQLFVLTITNEGNWTLMLTQPVEGNAGGREGRGTEAELDFQVINGIAQLTCNALYWYSVGEWRFHPVITDIGNTDEKYENDAAYCTSCCSMTGCTKDAMCQSGHR